MATQKLPLTSRARIVRALRLLLRGLAWTVGTAIVAAVVAVGALWWWAAQDGSLARALQLASRWQPLQVRDVEGALSDGGRIGELTWQQNGLTVQARNVAISWKPVRLLFGEFVLGPVSVASLRIDDQRPASAAPAAPPVSLGLPLRVSLEQVSVERLVYSGNAHFEATEIAGRYGFDGLFHDVALASVQVAQGKYSGRARLGAYGELPVDAQLHGEFNTPLPAGGIALPFAFDAQINGPIAQLKAHAALRAQNAATQRAAPEATLDADIAPFAPQPLQQAQAVFRSLDLAALWPGAPQTLLSGDARVRPDSDRVAGAPETWVLTTTVDNAVPGPVDRQRLPLARLEASGEWRAGIGLVRNLKARLAGGELTATGEWTDAGTLQWQVTGQARNIDPGQVYAGLQAQPLNGQATVKGQGAGFGFEMQVAAAAGSSAVLLARPAARTATPALNLRTLRLREAKIKGRWDRPQLQLDSLQVRTDDSQLDAALRLAVPVRGASGRVDFTAPGLKLSASGDLRETTGAGQLDLVADDTERAVAWLRQWPGMKDLLPAWQAAGRATLGASWQGGWRDPKLDARVSVPSLDVRGAAAQALQLRGMEATLKGRIADARMALRGNAAMGERRLTLQAAAEGGQTGYSAARTPDWRTAPWQARVTELAASLQDPALGRGAWRLALRTNSAASAPLQLRWTPRAAGPWLEASPGEAVLTAPVAASAVVPAVPTAATGTSATIAWQPVRWRPGELITAGRIQGLPLAWIETIAGPQLAGLGLTGTLVFDGAWDATVAETLRLSASLARSAGDLTVRAEDGSGGATRIAAGVREAKLTIDNNGDRLNLALRWDSERAGTADGSLATRLARGDNGGWTWPAEAPLEGRLAAQLPRIGVWSVLAPPGWRLRGSLGTDLTIAGTRAAPTFSGNLNADDLALRSVVDGIEFGNGRLRARLEGTRMRIDEFVLQGAGEKGAGGTLTAKGEAGWIDGRAQARLVADVKQLRASIRTDRQVTVSGQLTAQLDGRAAELKGALAVDRALIVLPDETKPTLGDDVVVISGGAASAGAKAPAETAAAAEPASTDNRALALAVKLDLGNDFRIQGRGIDTRVRGTLDITGATLAAPRIVGTVRTFGGQYRAYGQRLDVEQGVLIFSGRPDNPALDILALRANMLGDQKVGVQITGTALLPRVRLYASPELSDAEKLSWLVLGRSSASGGAEAALLQQAAIALLGSRSGGMSGGLAAALGLDELSVRGSGTNESGATTQGAITLGKRFSRNFYAAYERSLSGALGTLYVFYDLSRRFTVRAQTGEQSAVDLIYTLSYD